MLNSVLNGPLVYPTIKVDGVIRLKTYEELSDKEKLQDDCDICATNIVLQGLPPDIYALLNHNQVAKQIWDWVKLLMQGIELSYQERECKLYNKFDKFAFIKGETLHDYYMRSAQLMNDIHIIRMTMHQVYHLIINKSKAPISHLPSSTSQHAYQAPSIIKQPLVEFPQLDSGLAVPSFLPGDDLIGRQNQGFAGNGSKRNAAGSGVHIIGGNNAACQARVVKCYNCQGKGHMARKCTQSKRPRNSAWVAVGQDSQTTMPLNVAFQTDDLDAFDSDCDKAPGASTFLMAHVKSQ
ncbi:retrovirus-related pol polyprotein from transposon TNT 1-94 [Tanacetum coccineum]